MISCDLHDYFEIVCMRGSQVKITTQSATFLGTAKTIKQHQGQEFLTIKKGEEEISIALLEVTKLQALGNPIKTHNFEIDVS